MCAGGGGREGLYPCKKLCFPLFLSLFNSVPCTYETVAANYSSSEDYLLVLKEISFSA